MTPAERYLASFPAGRVEEFAVRGLDELDVPLHSAAIPAGPDHPGGSGLGYGATPEAARTGALGEMAEMALSTRALAGLERPQASFAELVRERGRHRVQDPRTLCLEAGSAYDDDRPLQWLPMVRARDGEQVLVPAELVASAPEDLPGRAAAGRLAHHRHHERPGRGVHRRGRRRARAARGAAAARQRGVVPRDGPGRRRRPRRPAPTRRRSRCSTGCAPPASTSW